jgi:hypothetical protein
MEDRNWKLVKRNWKLENRNWKIKRRLLQETHLTGTFHFPVSIFQFPKPGA